MAAESLPLKKGFYHLAADVRGGIAWQGELLRDFWMWNRQYTEYKGGLRLIQTVRVTDLKEAAIRYWRDKWVPLRPVDKDLLRRMEDCLRTHRGLRDAGVTFPPGEFLTMPEPIPEESLGDEVRSYMGLPPAKKKGSGKRPAPAGRLGRKAMAAYKKSKKEVRDGDVVL